MKHIEQLYQLLNKFEAHELDAHNKVRQAPDITLALASAAIERSWWAAQQLLTEAIAVMVQDEGEDEPEATEFDFGALQAQKDQVRQAQIQTDRLRWAVLGRIDDGWSTDDLDEWLRSTTEYGLAAEADLHAQQRCTCKKRGH
jgi:hypothetical protein